MLGVLEKVSVVLLRRRYPQLRLYTVMAESWKRSGLVKGIGIPAPSGQHPVGCVDLMHQFEGDDQGGLLVRLFYPAQLSPDRLLNSPSIYATWTPNRRYLKAYLDFLKSKSSGFFASITNAIIDPRTPAVWGAALLGAHQPQSSSAGAEPEQSGEGVNVESSQFPVIVFCHGLGGMRTTSSGICCDLASHGYVVAAVEHRDRSACISLQRVPCPDSSPDKPQFQDEWLEHYHKQEGEKEFYLRNKQVKQRSRDAILALELLTKLNEGVDVRNMMEGNFNFSQFQARLDVGKAAIMGHSFGGATTIQALSEDQRFLCGIAMDCWMIPIHRDLLETGVQQPLLFINSFHFQWPDNVKKMMKLTRPPEHTGASSCTLLTLKGTNHMTQCDLPFLIPMFVQRWLKWAAPIDPTEGHIINLDICYAFFRRFQLRDPSYLEPVPNLDGGEGHSEHILFGTNLDLSAPSEDGPTQPPPGDGVTKQDDPTVSGTQGEGADTGDKETAEKAEKEERETDTAIENEDTLVEEFVGEGESAGGEANGGHTAKL